MIAYAGSFNAPPFFFREEAAFPYHHASEACGDLAVLGMELLQRGMLELAAACGASIRSIALSSAKAGTPRSFTSFYGFADWTVMLELLARAADALGCTAASATFRSHASRPEGISDEMWPEYEEAVATRTRQMDDRLCERGRDFQLQPDPVAVLRDILNQHREMAS